MSEHVLAIDIGGTNVKAGLVDREGAISHVIHRPSRAAEGREALLGVLQDVVREQQANGDFVAIGTGSPGTISHTDGSVLYMQTHMPRWTGTPLGALLAEWSGVPATVDNDVNVIALGENWKGVGQGARCQISLALGTGLGGGVVIDGVLYRGAQKRGIEIGHVIVCPGGEPCTCGNFGCVEVYTAPGAMARRARRYLATGVPSELDPDSRVIGSDIIRLAGEGDHLCMKLLDDATHYLSLLMWQLCAAFDPDVFVLGGGLLKAGDAFLQPVAAKLARYHYPPQLEPRFRIAVSELSDTAGILGAAKLAWDWLDGVDRA
jgi:glucokinase